MDRRYLNGRFLLAQCGFVQLLAQVLHNLLNQRRIWPWKNKQIPRALSNGGEDNKVLG